MTTIEIPVRELHARTGHYVRKASRDTEVIVTDRGRPAARLAPLGESHLDESRPTLGVRRKLLPGYRALLASGALRSGPDSVSADPSDRAMRDL